MKLHASVSLKLIALAVLSFPCLAQVTTSTFLGTVTDPGGGVIVGANVTLINQETGVATSKTTGADGSFQFDFLRIGTYRLKISAAGFKSLQTGNIDLAAGSNLRRAFTLELGAVNETVSVEGSAPLVNVVSAEQSQSVSRTEAAQLPLAKRNVANLLGLGTGVSPGAGFVRLNGVGKTGTLYYGRWHQCDCRSGEPHYLNARQFRAN